MLIAFCGGATGVLALTTKSKGQVIPGVAIATALMPPLCTAGYGLATAQWNCFFGAFYLFFINTVFIALAAEAQALFPQVEHVGVGRVGSGTVAIVHLRRGARLADADRSKMDKWLAARMGLEDVEIIVR